MELWEKHIRISSDIRFGKPSIKETRIAVGDILQWLASGMTYDEILADYPELTMEKILAVLQFAACRDHLTKMIVA